MGVAMESLTLGIDKSKLRGRAIATLQAAADAAEQRGNADEAVSIAWATLHRDHDLFDSGSHAAFQSDYAKLLGVVFGAWKHVENFHSETPYLGDTLRRRYNTSSEIAGSLRHAAELVASWHPSVGD